MPVSFVAVLFDGLELLVTADVLPRGEELLRAVLVGLGGKLRCEFLDEPLLPSSRPNRAPVACPFTT